LTSENEERERPRAVTVIGWTCLVLSLLRLVQDLFGWVVWKVGGFSQTLSFFGMPRASGLPIDMLFKHFDTIVVVQAIFAAVVAYVAYGFLRMRPWGRLAMEVVCWSVLVLLATVAALLMVWSHRNVTDASPRVAAAIALNLAIAGLLPGLVIWFLRRPSVRQAFERPQ